VGDLDAGDSSAGLLRVGRGLVGAGCLGGVGVLWVGFVRVGRAPSCGDRRVDLDAGFAFAYLAAEILPGGVSGDLGGFRLLRQDEQEVAERVGVEPGRERQPFLLPPILELPQSRSPKFPR
jgi:hypothetical protein